MKRILTSIAAVSLIAGAASAPAFAQADREPVSSISQLLERVRQDSRDAAAENQRRLQEFRSERDRQAVPAEPGPQRTGFPGSPVRASAGPVRRQ
jgi:biopolymer transport protein ExbB